MPAARKTPKKRRPVASAKRTATPPAMPTAKRTAKPATKPGKKKRAPNPALKPAAKRPAQRVKRPAPTSKARGAKARVEQLAAEIAVIDSIQQGMAGALGFQGIVDLVGDKLRVVFNTESMGIRWYDWKTNLAHYLYEYEQGVRVEYPPIPPQPGGTFSKMVATHEPLILRSHAEGERLGLQTLGTPSKSSVYAPIVANNRVIGQIALYNYEREDGYSESDVRMLCTIGASMGVALENARLLDETQRLLKETEQRNAELAVINSIQQGMAGTLDFQGIVDWWATSCARC